MFDDRDEADPPIRSRRLPRHRLGNIVVIGVSILGLLGLLSTILHEDRQSRSVLAPTAKTRQSQDAMKDMRQLRLWPRQDGWSIKLSNDVYQQAATRPADDDFRSQLQSEAVASTIGIDARVTRRIAGFGSHFLAASRQGSTLLLGGIPSQSGGPQRFGSRLLMNMSIPAGELPEGGIGPVAFQPDETPVQLIARPGTGERPDELCLMDLRQGKVITRFEIPGTLAISYYHDLGLAPDASAVGAPVRRPDGMIQMVVWSASSPRPLHQFPVASRFIAFTEDGSLVGAGDHNGIVSVWSMATGQLNGGYSSFPSNIPVRNLAFGPARMERGPNGVRLRTRLLAISDSEGTITIRTVHERPQGTAAMSRMPELQQDQGTTCKIRAHDISAMAFSSDGTLLGSCGEDQAHLWDPITGRLLLSLDAGPDLKSLVFSPQGRNFVLCSSGDNQAGTISIWSIRDGSSIKFLRGLANRFVVCAASPEASVPLVAAWTRKGRVNVWSRPRSLLRHDLPTPLLAEFERPALAFSPDGQRLAFAGGRTAHLWDLHDQTSVQDRSIALKTAAPVRTHRLSALSFVAADHLVLTQVEAGRSLRSYDLLAAEPGKPLLSLNEPSGNIVDLATTPDGQTALLLVTPQDSSGGYTIRACRLPSGEPVWSQPLGQAPREGRALLVSPDGTLLAVRHQDDGPAALFEIATGQPRTETLPGLIALGPGATSWISWSNRSISDPGGLQVYGQQGGRPSVLIPAEMIPGIPAEASLSRDGHLAIWLNMDNTVTACDLLDLNRRLTEAKLGW